MSWQENAPIYKRLPAESEQYQGNSVAEWLCAPWDELLVETKGKTLRFYDEALNPLTCKAENLDWLGQLAGFSDEYGLAEYPANIKRQLIARSFDFIWVNKGTSVLLEWLFVVFEIEAQIYSIGQFLADNSAAGDLLGGSPFQYYIRLPLKYLRTSNEWQEVEKLDRLYSPIYVDSAVVYQQFYCGFSVAGDPVFD